jgi:hypothetical protein
MPGESCFISSRCNFALRSNKATRNRSNQVIFMKQHVATWLLSCLAASVMYAQDVRATIGGRVVDPHQASVPGAIVTVVSDETNVKQTTRTNNQGNWIEQFLLPGHYRISVAAPGFKAASREGIELQAADNKQFDIQLEVGSQSQSVVVSGDSPLIDTTSAVSGTVITNQEILELPSASHVVTLLATLSPGVVQQDQNNNVVHL